MIAILGILTISITVAGHQVYMPPVFGMMFGLGMLGTYGYFRKTRTLEKINSIFSNSQVKLNGIHYYSLVFVGGLALLDI